MKILSFETVNNKSSVSLCVDGEIIDTVKDEQSNKQAEMLITNIENILEKNNTEYKDLDLVVTSNGPGSFTSIRISLAAAQGIAIATEKNFYAVSKMDALAYYASHKTSKKNVTVVVDAKRGQLFCQNFSLDKLEKSTPTLLNTENFSDYLIEDTVIIGCDYELMAKLITDSSIDFIECKDFDLSSEIARICCKDISSFIVKNDVKPIYMRGADAKISDKSKSLI